MNLIIGTAGHIDHGKTSLVKALTGTDADRLPEEKRRGITIDLGFAELQAGDLHIAFVDVPGHERFVRNMLAGASGIDLVMLVVAADEGVMPQTREHFEICRLLGVGAGMIVITKCDLADSEMIEIVKLEVEELVADSFLRSSPVIEVSTRTGDGIPDIMTALKLQAAAIQPRGDLCAARLPVDRSFSVKGFGAVVTGTLIDGSVRLEDEMELLPGGDRVRVRGLQTQNRSVRSVAAGQRTALNLGGIDHSAISRGMVVAEPGLVATQMLDAEIEAVADVKKTLRSRQRIRFHIGSAEVLGRLAILDAGGQIASGEKGLAQIRLETPVVALPGDRFIIRSESPQATIAGGVVLDPHPAKHRKRDFEKVAAVLQKLKSSEGPAEKLRLFIESSGTEGLNKSDLMARTGFRPGVLESGLAANTDAGKIINANGVFLARQSFDDLGRRTIKFIDKAQITDPLAAGVAREKVRDAVFGYLRPEIFKAVLAGLEDTGSIVSQKELVRTRGHATQFSPQQAEVVERLRANFRSDNYEVPKLADALRAASENTKVSFDEVRKLFHTLQTAGEVVKISEEFYFSKAAIATLIEKMRRHAETAADPNLDVASFKAIAGVSRKYAIPLLEYFDRENVTQRKGDKRIILK